MKCELILITGYVVCLLAEIFWIRLHVIFVLYFLAAILEACTNAFHHWFNQDTVIYDFTIPDHIALEERFFQLKLNSKSVGLNTLIFARQLIVKITMAQRFNGHNREPVK